MYQGAPIKLERKAAYIERKKEERHSKPNSTFSASADTAAAASAPGASAAQPSAPAAGGAAAAAAAAGTSGGSAPQAGASGAEAAGGTPYDTQAPLSATCKVSLACCSQSIPAARLRHSQGISSLNTAPLSFRVPPPEHSPARLSH